MTPADALTVPPEVLARRLGEETVILHLETGTYFGLDPVGARIWDLIVEGHTLAGICDRMLEEYEVDPATLQRDVLALAGELAAKGLVVRGGPTP
jgi:hypothetical protein